MKKFRLLQLITGFHYIHHYHYSFGFKLPFIKVAWFKQYGLKKINKLHLKDKDGNDIINPYHNCSWSGVY